uniref:flagellar biosynthetic protein FliO n=1 Tax=Cellvibrio fontiphilus TaxID=1815559 RepID=UPI002B4BACD1|nr:flagellar biosynthetic protein FliO [Cellvibrio fontiphilus]
MTPAPVKMLMRILCAGLCCFALAAYADSTSSSQSHSGEQQVAVSTTVGSTAATSPVSNSSVTSPAVAPATTLATTNSASPVTATSVGGGRHLLSVTVALFGIIGLIFAISWFVKRFGHVGFSQNQHIKIIAAMPLGTRERIVLVDAAGQQLLLGITATSITTLHSFQEPAVLTEKDDRASDFSRKLMSILQQKPGAAGENNNDNSGAR